MAKEQNTVDNKKKALDLALSQIEKQFGKGAIMRMGEGVRLDISVVPTGIISLDKALGVVGFLEAGL